MTITIELAPEIEQQVRQAASQAGTTPDSYILAVIQAHLHQKQTDSTHTSRASDVESDLLQKINSSLSAIAWTKYHELIAKRQAETLSSEEQQDLINLTNQIEAANAQRIALLAELARLRNTPLDTLITELGIKPQNSHA